MSLISFASIAQTPIMETIEVYNITGNSAILRGKVKRATGGGLLISRGFADQKNNIFRNFSYEFFLFLSPFSKPFWRGECEICRLFDTTGWAANKNE